MKALTIWQPWATLIVAGAKPYEFRGWRAPRSIIGQRIVIHAAARKVSIPECNVLALSLSYGGDSAAQTCLHADLAIPILEAPYKLPLSCGLGTAIVGEPRNGVDIAGEFGLSWANDSDRQDHANWGWPLLEIERWPEPVPMKGAQGFWTWPEPDEFVS